MDQQPNTAEPQKPRLRWFQFRLRTLLIGVTLVCVMSGVLVNRANRQRRAVDTITRLGGIVRYYYQDEGRLFIPGFDGPPPGPDWLRNLIGIDYLANVKDVAFIAPITDDDDLFRAMEDLPGLRALIFDESTVGDSTLQRIKPLTQLKELTLSNTQVTDAGLRNLVGMTHLEWLDAYGTKITTNGIRELRRAIPNLEIVGP